MEFPKEIWLRRVPTADGVAGEFKFALMPETDDSEHYVLHSHQQETLRQLAQKLEREAEGTDGGFVDGIYEAVAEIRSALDEPVEEGLSNAR